ncbi:hypothetical protein FG386_001772 [Cryptosporidium ryanae]|uniref:uncharacterized protein n=1 Tax=Cryptosporidium ryanae TaxID=515981 RepID=UPI00351A3DE9|nr:hypothetical protein FG386_001772 [Cryptosporidium ryanae]
MFKSFIYHIIFIFFLVSFKTIFIEFVKSEILIDNNSSSTNSWFGVDAVNGFIPTGNYNLTSANIFEGFNEITSFSKQERKKNNSWMHESLSGLISRLNVNSMKEQGKSSLNDKFLNLKQYFWRETSKKVKKPQNESTLKPNFNLFPFSFGRKNVTNIDEGIKAENKVLKLKKSIESDKVQKNLIQTKKTDETADSDFQNNQTDQNTILNQECERNVINGFRECIERCKNGLKLIQAKTGGITPMNLSELNTCIQNCRQEANSAGCKLTNNSIKIINEEIAIPKPTIRRNQNKNYRNRGLLYIYVIDPIFRFLLTLIFVIVGIIVALYYFKDYRLYPKFADHITSIIESFYTEDEKRRAIFEGDCFPQQPKQNWKRTIIYFVRLNFLPRFFATSFTWLVPMRDHYQQAVENSSYIRIH